MQLDQNNFLERGIYLLNPKWALERSNARAMIAVQQQMRKYASASMGPLTADWYAPGTSANAEILADLPKLRNRMREMVRNEGWAYSAIHKLANNVVGKGIIPYFTSNDADKDLREKIAADFLEYCKSSKVDYWGRHNMYSLQRLGMLTMAHSGDYLMLRRIKGKGKQAQLSIMLLECDYLVDWYYSHAIENKEGAYCEGGIYYDKDGQVYGYEIYHSHPGDSTHRKFNTEHSFISAKDMTLVFRAERLGQTRGVPSGHSVMLEIKQLGQYELAQAQKQTLSASYAVFIKSTAGATMGNTPGASAKKEYADLNGSDVEPGMIYNLFPGEDIQFATPPDTGDFDPYTKNKLRKISQGFGLTYEQLSGDLSNVNFSSGRMGWLESQRNFSSWQDMTIIPMHCNRVLEWWIELEQLKGNIPLDLRSVKANWTPPRREMIDPVKETNAILAQLAAGLVSLPDAIRQMGSDPMELLQEISSTYTILDKLKLILSSDYRVINAQKMKGKDKPQKPA